MIKNIISKVILSSALISILTISAGLLLYLDDGRDDILWFGILILILTPLFSILASMMSFIRKKEWNWIIVSAVLLLVIFAGMLLSILI